MDRPTYWLGWRLGVTDTTFKTCPVVYELLLKTTFDMLPSFSESSRIVSPPVSTRLEMFNSSKLSNIFSLCEKNFRLSELHILPIFWLQVEVRSIADKVEDHVDDIDEEERGKQPEVHSVQVQLRWLHRLLVPFAHYERAYHLWASKRRVLIAP